MPRQTADVIALILAGTVATVVIMTAVALLVVRVIHPEADTEYAAEQISRIISVLVAALVGFMAGRRVDES